MRLVRSDGAEVVPSGDVVALEEAWSYRLELPAGAAAFVEGTPLAPVPGGFELPIGHWVGDVALEVHANGTTHPYRLRIAPRPEKLAPHAWTALLEDLETWLPGVTTGDVPSAHGAAGTRGADAPHVAAALLPLVPALHAAARAIAASPREAVRETWEDVPMRAVRRVDGATIRWLSRTAAASALHGTVEELGIRPPLVPQRLPHPSLDHPANRYVRWALLRAAARLDACAARLAAVDDPWCRGRARRAEAGAASLRELVARTFLRAITAAPPTQAALLAVQDDPLYARLHRLVRPFLAPRFELADGLAAAARPSFTLYELWTFLALKRVLAASLPGATWTRRGLASLAAGTGNGARFTANLPDGAVLRLHFNPTFPGYLARGTGRHSLSGERRPDLVVTFERGAEKAWVCLDAKYRVRAPNVADALVSLHVYRDSLRWPAYGGPCRAAWILVPAREAACAPWFAPSFHLAHGQGAWRLTPGKPLPHELGAAVLAALGCTSQPP